MSAEHTIVVDLGYGDAGKGTVVDWLCARGFGQVSAGDGEGTFPTERVRRRPGSTSAGDGKGTFTSELGLGRRESTSARGGKGTFTSERVRRRPESTSPSGGKGTFTNGLGARGPESVHAVVRFNGGGQAAHNVVTDDGRHHTFAQFGSGSFSPGVATHLSRFMLVDPLALVVEADHLASVGVPGALNLLTVDRDALLTTPYHRAANRARELARGAGRHGSCGQGVGETASYALAHDDAPRAGDGRRTLRRRLGLLRDRLTDEVGPLDVPGIDDCVAAFEAFSERVRIVGGEYLTGLLHSGPVVFEGAQGVLLDEWHGFHPYTTWSTTTFANAEALLAESGLPGAALRLGVVRAYAVRHGPGPFVTEDPLLTAALPESHNRPGPWQGPVRVGHLDLVALRYAAEVCAAQGHPVDAAAVTCLDVAARTPGLRICRSYGVTAPPTPGTAGDLDRQASMTARLMAASPVLEEFDGDWASAIETELGLPVVLASYGPASSDKIAGDRALLSPR